jgi:hypothetical protein
MLPAIKVYLWCAQYSEPDHLRFSQSSLLHLCSVQYWLSSKAGSSHPLSLHVVAAVQIASTGFPQPVAFAAAAIDTVAFKITKADTNYLNFLNS